MHIVTKFCLILSTIDLPSANVFNIKMVSKLSFGIELNQTLHLNPFPNDKFQTLPNSKSFQTTISNVMKMAESSPIG